jgi:hypothetical protein
MKTEYIKNLIFFVEKLIAMELKVDNGSQSTTVPFAN